MLPIPIPAASHSVLDALCSADIAPFPADLVVRALESISVSVSAAISVERLFKQKNLC